MSASTTSAIAERCGSTGPDSTSSATYHLAAQARTGSAAWRAARSQPRTVSGGRLSRSANTAMSLAQRGAVQRVADHLDAVASPCDQAGREQNVGRPTAAAASAAQTHRVLGLARVTWTRSIASSSSACGQALRGGKRRRVKRSPNAPTSCLRTAAVATTSRTGFRPSASSPAPDPQPRDETRGAGSPPGALDVRRRKALHGGSL